MSNESRTVSPGNCTYTLRNHGQSSYVSGVFIEQAYAELKSISGGVPVITCDQTGETVYDGKYDGENDDEDCGDCNGE